MSKKYIRRSSKIIFEKGLNNCNNYRIPSIITTSKGTLIAAIDARVDEPGDNPNNIDKVIRRSTDLGVTWNDVQVLVDYPGTGRQFGAAATDPAMLEDLETNTIWMIFNHTPAGIGLWQSQRGAGFDHAGRKVLLDELKKEYLLLEDGSVIDIDGKLSKYTVANNGDVIAENEVVGNIYFHTGPLLEERTSFLQAIYSTDDGLTWSKPIDLNLQVKSPWMRFIGAGPGIGIQLKSEKYKGRLIFPIYYSNDPNGSTSRMSCCLIYSDDHGKTWHRGLSPNDGRNLDGVALNSQTLSIHSAELTESQVVELDNGDLKLYMRNHSPKKRIAYSISKDGGQTWGDVIFDESLINPICQISVIKHSNFLYFSGAMNEVERENGQVLVSKDEGQTWEHLYTLTTGSFIYSCISILPDNSIGILHEVIADDDIKIYFDVLEEKK